SGLARRARRQRARRDLRLPRAPCPSAALPLGHHEPALRRRARGRTPREDARRVRPRDRAPPRALASWARAMDARLLALPIRVVAPRAGASRAPPQVRPRWGLR